MQEMTLMAEPRNRQDRIREDAFLLWNADGRSEGKADEYWFRAEKTIDGLDRLSHEGRGAATL